MALTVEYIVNGSAFYASEDNALIQCTVKFNEIDEEIPFCADANDCESHGAVVHQMLVNGDAGDIGPYVEPNEIHNQ